MTTAFFEFLKLSFKVGMDESERKEKCTNMEVVTLREEVQRLQLMSDPKIYAMCKDLQVISYNFKIDGFD